MFHGCVLFKTACGGACVCACMCVCQMRQNSVAVYVSARQSGLLASDKSVSPMRGRSEGSEARKRKRRWTVSQSSTALKRYGLFLWQCLNRIHKWSRHGQLDNLSKQ